MTDLGQRGPISIGKELPTLNLAYKNPVFSDEIFIAQENFLVHCSGDIGQQARPIPSNPPTLKRGSRVGIVGCIRGWEKVI
jgi:hypothetical protein